MKKLSLILLLVASAAYGEMYTWTDSRGTSHFVSSQYDIPARYRSRAKVYDVATGKKMPLSAAAPAAPTSAPAAGSAQPAAPAAVLQPQSPQLQPPQPTPAAPPPVLLQPPPPSLQQAPTPPPPRAGRRRVRGGSEAE